MRAYGGSWEQWEDELTVQRFRLIVESEEEIPPLYITAYLVAISLGAIKPPENSDPQSLPPGSGFISMFGPGGTLGSGSM